VTTTGSRGEPALPRTVLVVGPDPGLVEAVLTDLAGSAEVRAGGLVLHRAADGLQLLHAVGPSPRPAAVQAGLRLAGGLLLVLPAVGGPDPAAVQVWEQCTAEGRARVLVVTGFAAHGADHDEAVALGQRLLGDDLHPLTVPMHGDDDGVAGVLDVLRLEVADSSTGARVLRHPDPEHTAMVGGLRDDLVEALLADSDDDTLLDRYLAGAPLSLPTLTAELRAAVAAGRVAPTLAVSGAVGLVELAALLAGLPGPPDLLEVDADGGALQALAPDPQAGVVARSSRRPTEAGWSRCGRAPCSRGSDCAARPGSWWSAT
jgi:elongation factor G